jgi:hypothetical protein
MMGSASLAHLELEAISVIELEQSGSEV